MVWHQVMCASHENTSNIYNWMQHCIHTFMHIKPTGTPSSPALANNAFPTRLVICNTINVSNYTNPITVQEASTNDILVMIPFGRPAIDMDWNELHDNHPVIIEIKIKRISFKLFIALAKLCFIKGFNIFFSFLTCVTSSSKCLMPIPSSAGFARQHPTNLVGYFFKTLRIVSPH